MDTRFRAVHVSLSLALVTLAAACSSPPEPTVDDEWDRIRIALIVDGQRLTGTLSDTPAGRDLLAQLPLTLTMTDFGSVEKVAELPTSLSITGAHPAQTLPRGTSATTRGGTTSSSTTATRATTTAS